MASASEIKGRINSVLETKKVTDAMYMISSVKMRKAIRDLTGTEKYFEALQDQIGDMLRYMPESENRFFRVPPPVEGEHQCHGIVLVTSDKGLAGSYNQTAIREAEAYMHRHPTTRLFIVGEYGRQYFASRRIPFVEEFHYSAAFPSVTEAQGMAEELLEWYGKDLVDDINLIYTDYHGTRPSECKRKVLLPLNRSHFEERAQGEPLAFPPEFYPDFDTVLSGTVPRYLTGFIYASLVDSFCSEQQARMNAMSTAGKNAEDMLKRLKMEYNSVRQAAITREMIEISAGAKALKAKRQKQSEENGNG